MISKTSKTGSITSMIVLIILAFCCQTAVAYGQPLIQTDKDIYNYGEAITVRFYNAPGYARDWICIVPAGSPDTEAGDYQYIPEGAAQGALIFKSPRPGQYEARAYYNYSAFRYIVSDRYLFTVAGEAYGYDDPYGGVNGQGYNDAYVDVPIIYGEPYYLAPPIAVSFLFDYFTYELVDGFVDLVFWRGGHRHHREHWYDHGRRVPDWDIRSRERHQRVRDSELFQHREKLRKNHNISHPDSYYGLKSPSNRQIPQSQRPQWGQRQFPQVQQRPQRMEQKPQWGQKKSPQVQQRPPRMEQKPQWGQRQSPQVQQRSQRMEQRSPSGQKQYQKSGTQHQKGEPR
jgi:hypothetical protein